LGERAVLPACGLVDPTHEVGDLAPQRPIGLRDRLPRRIELAQRQLVDPFANEALPEEIPGAPPDERRASLGPLEERDRLVDPPGGEVELTLPQQRVGVLGSASARLDGAHASTRAKT